MILLKVIMVKVALVAVLQTHNFLQMVHTGEHLEVAAQVFGLVVVDVEEVVYVVATD
jgi:hypothetical protein